MMYLIMLPCYLIVGAAFLFTMNYICKPNGNLLLGVKIPKEEMNRPEVQAIVHKNKKREHILNLFMLVLMAAAFFIRRYSIISTIYSLAWVFVYLGGMELIFFKAYDELYAFKKSQGWVVGETCTISVDTEVARLKSHFLYPKWHWILILLLTIIGSFLWIPETKDSMIGYVMIGVIVLTYLVLLGIYFIVPKVKTTVYSNQSEVNVALNRCYCYQLTKAMVWAGYANALCWLIAGFAPDSEYNFIAILSAAIVSSILVCGCIFVGFYQVNKERRLFDNMEKVDFMVDDDIYWRGGMYSNPNDPKLWVEKRNGIGMQMNAAHPASKIVNVLATVIILGVFVWLFTCIPLDFPFVSLHINQDVLYVEATQYDQEISVNEVERAEVITELPRMYKNNGYADQGYDFGKFRVTGYGQSKVYVNKEISPYLVLYVGEEIYIINSDNEEELQNCMNYLEDKGLLEQTE